MSVEIFAQRLQSVLDKHDISQNKFATMLGVQQPTVWQYCNGKRMPSAVMVARISELLDVSTDYLLGRTDKF